MYGEWEVKHPECVKKGLYATPNEKSIITVWAVVCFCQVNLASYILHSAVDGSLKRDACAHREEEGAKSSDMRRCACRLSS